MFTEKPGKVDKLLEDAAMDSLLTTGVLETITKRFRKILKTPNIQCCAAATAHRRPHDGTRTVVLYVLFDEYKK